MDFTEATNWVDKQGGLPGYIKRIEKHLERKGMSKSHAIATAVNVAKKMCASGDVNWPGKQQVNAGSQAEACAAVARWNQMKAAAGESARNQMEAMDAMTLSETVGAGAVGDMLTDLPKPTEFTEATSFGEGVRSLQGSKMQIRAITPGWGSSGYYSEAVLKKAVTDGLFREGTQMFLDHPTVEQSESRPERSIRDLAAVITKPGVYAGDGVYAEVDVFPPFREALAAMKDHIGVSIRARGFAEQGEAEGNPGTIITELSELASVDFVTRPGRGGAITALLESAREHPQDPPETKQEQESAQEADTTTGGPVSGTESQGSPTQGTPTIPPTTIPPAQPVAVQESERVTELQKQLAEAQETLAIRAKAGVALTEAERQLAEAKAENQRLRASEKARAKTAEALAESGLPEAAFARVTAAVIGYEGRSLPLAESGDLDGDKLKSAIDAAVTAEKSYVASVLESAGVGAPKGLGGGNNGNKMTDEKFQESFTSILTATGMDETTAKLAAKGRS